MPCYKLFANCIIVKGANRSLICDLERHNFSFIPHVLGALFDSDAIINTDVVLKMIAPDDVPILEEYLSLLEGQEYIFPCTAEDATKFPKLDLSWDYPGEVTNCIIDISRQSNHDFEHIITELRSVNCRHMMIRVFDDMPLAKIMRMMSIINDSPIRSVDILLKDSAMLFSHDEVIDWVKANKKIRCLTLHSSNKNDQINPSDYGFVGVFLVEEVITSDRHCGLIHPHYFSVNIESFSESQTYNSCLNRKISIDSLGNIKNCPSFSVSHGHISNVSLLAVLGKHGFKKYWQINKDQIEICRDCEFRHICTDCRAFVEDVGNLYSKPLKCGYDPYTSTWEAWATNPLKKKAIEYYGINVQ